jgi:hypothetical protein
MVRFEHCWQVVTMLLLGSMESDSNGFQESPDGNCSMPHAMIF